MKIDLKKINTENINENTKDIDRVSTLELVKKINNEDKKVALAIEEEISNIAKAIDVITLSLQQGGRLIYSGAGTSGRLGILDASECPPTYGVPEDLIQGVIAGGTEAVFKSVENAEDSEGLGADDLKKINFSKSDVLVGIAASGRTPYVVGALNYANSLGAKTIAISCSKNSIIGALATIAIEVNCGPEVITGSTRMKAGTAQKMILNMLSTGTMIKLGKTYGNLMVDVKALNAKLVERCKKIFMESTGQPYEIAEKYLEKTKYNVKLAILMEKTGLNIDTASIELEKNHGLLHKTISGFKKGK
jgi:N-acetylmuramic acid 6-phosphate etherase